MSNSIDGFKLGGKAAIVTGAAVGLGREIALAFADAGAFVGVHFHHSRKEAEEVLAEVKRRGSDGLLFQADLTKEYGPEIRTNSVCPGVIETRHHTKTPPERLAAYRAATPLKRNGQAQEVALAVLYLASDASSFTNGALLDVNGGRVLR